MNRVRWIEPVLCACALLMLLCACSETHQEMHSNTNWLRRCGEQADCDGGQICACGVCTAACTEDDACARDGADEARCVSMSDSECGGAKGAVCAAACHRDAECDDGLSCVLGGCVEVMSVDRTRRDASLPVAIGDPVGGRNGGVDGQPPDGPTDCGGPCRKSEVCARGRCQRAWNGAGCEPAPAVREACSGTGTCAQGEVCHIDGTCIVPGQCDEIGETTLAEVGNVGELVLTRDAVFVVDRGMEDGLGNLSGGAILRIPFGGGNIVSLAEDIDRPWLLLVDGERVFWDSVDVTERSLWTADRDGVDPVQFAVGGNVAWAQTAGEIYFLTERPGEFFMGGDQLLYRHVKASRTVELVSDEGVPTFSDGMGVDSRYVYFNGFRRPLAGDATAAFPFAGNGLELSRERAISVSMSGAERLLSVDKSGNDLLVHAKVEGSVGAMSAFREHIYYEARLDGSTANGHAVELRRAPIVPGESETLVAFTPPADDPDLVYDTSSLVLEVSDQGLFWPQEGRLLRKVIEDYVGIAPAQGAEGGPCFGDLGCDAGLTCVDTICRGN